jgi:hypothetical protein
VWWRSGRSKIAPFGVRVLTHHSNAPEGALEWCVRTLTPY